jgi:pyruvate,water dikinase
MAQELNLLGGSRYAELFRVLDGIRKDIAGRMQDAPASARRPEVLRLHEEQALDPMLVGGKAAGLCLLNQRFPGHVPEGFILTVRAYDLFAGKGRLFEQIKLLLKNLEFTQDSDRFRIQTEAIRKAVSAAELPPSIEQAIRQYSRAFETGEPDLWAVRSSAVSEDGRFSFAGQFDSLLNVPLSGLPEAYKEVVAGKFTERAVTYRMHCGFREVDTPMAVLFMPMIRPKAAGVIYTADPARPDADCMVVHCVEGLGDKVVKGLVVPDSIEILKEPVPRIAGMTVAGNPVSDLGYISRDTLLKIGSTALKAAEAFGYDLDMEWAVDRKDHLWILQGRRVQLSAQEKIRDVPSRKGDLFASRGVSIFPGRSEGRVAVRSAQNPAPIPKGAVLVLRQPIPEMASLVPNAASVIAAEGSPVGHLATILREFAVPSIFQAGEKILDLAENSVVSIDASKREIYIGSRWPGIRERVLSRLASAGSRAVAGPLFGPILSLNLSDPFASGFKPSACRSVHDVIRFIHEMSVRSMFRFGDKHSGLLHRKTKRILSHVPMPILALPLEQPLPAGSTTVKPDAIASAPFRAFWEGFSDERLAWPDRLERMNPALSRDIQDQIFGGVKGPRRRKDPNYLIYAADYMNFNSRFAYHYAMLDSLLGTGDRNNYIQLRFHSGGGSDEKRKRRARFLERVLRESRFGVSLDGDLIVAWFRNYPSTDTSEALTMLGRLLVCSRQLDVLMHLDSDVKMFSNLFLTGNFEAFS